MTKSIQKLKPDIVLKDYWKNNEKFADLLNAFFFDGKQMIKAEDLTNEDSDNSTVIINNKHINSLKSDRDLLKIVKFCSRFDVKFALIGLGNQANIHYAMPIRIVEYDANSYYNQWTKLKKHYAKTKELTGDEYLSGMKKTDKFCPVITIVLYYGEKPWDGAISLKELLDIPEQLQNFVNDYKMNLVEARSNKLIFHDVDNRNFFYLLQLLYNDALTTKERKRLAEAYDQQNHVSSTVSIAVASAAKSKISLDKLEQGDGNVCTVFEAIEAEGVAKGITQGLSQGIQALIESCQELGIDQKTTCEKLSDKFSLDEETAKMYMEKFWK